jgi:hypothetical protein
VCRRECRLELLALGCEVIVERVDEDRERRVVLKFVAASNQREAVSIPSPRDRFGNEAGLPDPRLADELKNPALPRRQAIQLAIDHLELGLSPNKLIRSQHWTKMVLRCGCEV